MQPLFDTNVFTTYKRLITPRDLARMALSMVVWYELTANTITPDEWQTYETWRMSAQREKRLLTPTMNDWRECARLVARVRWKEKRDHHRQTPKTNATKLQNDALIARSAYLNDAVVVTNNTSDFLKLQHFLDFKFTSAHDYFGFA